MPEMENDKKILRKNVRARLLAISDAERAEIGQSAAQVLLSSALWKNAGSVFCFWGMAGEVDTRPILSAALRENKRLCLPRCVPDRRGMMQAVRVLSLSDAALQTNGLIEPRGKEILSPREIDLAILPAVAVDRTGLRLGRGGGYYDRFLQDFGGDSVILVPQCAVLECVPREAHDRRAEWLLTERGLVRAEKVISCRNG